MRKETLKKLALLMIFTMLGSSAVFAATDASTVNIPSDVAGTLYEEAVTALFEKEIITGDTDGMFHPDSELTRAQACIIVVKSMNAPAAEITGTATQSVAKSGFSDMSGYGWAEGYIGYAVKHGVTKGYPDGTFKPGRPVTVNEFVTMVLRAAGHTDESLGGTWPLNYTEKAAELALFAGPSEPIANLNANATKWIAAQIDYNALDLIEKANPPAETPGQGTDQDKPDSAPDTAAMVFVNGSFNSSMTTYNGKAISEDAVVYTFGDKADYSSEMKLSKKTSDYRVDTVYKYKDVKTPAFYKIENGKITEMIVPMNVGFSGKAYGVINKTVRTLNGDNEIVTGVVTLTATREITWLTKKSIPTDQIPSSAEYLNGEIYELSLIDGEVRSIYNSSDVDKRGEPFEEISGTGIFQDVESFGDGLVEITGGTYFEVKANASVYVLEEDNPAEYTAGKLSNIKKGVKIRAYDISDDDERSADLVVIIR